MSSSNVLIVFMKAPRPGGVKTRLQPELTPEQALHLYRAMGLDLLENVRSQAYHLRIHFWPPDAEGEMQEWLGEEACFPQRGGDLGAKMHGAFCDTFAEGYRRVIIIGSDLPHLDHALIEGAFDRLADHDIVLGPTEDGGYYLIGLKAPHAHLFEAVEWSTERVWEQTLRNIRHLGLRLHTLPRLADIDTWAEVQQLWQALQGNSGSTLRRRLPRTLGVLREMFREEG